MSRTMLLPPPTNVVAGQTATLQMPIGPTYHDVLFTRGGTTFDYDDIDELRFIVHGSVKFAMSGVELDALNKYVGGAKAAANATQTLFSFDELGTRTLATKRMPAFRTGPAIDDKGQILHAGVSGARFEIDISSGASNPTLSAKARFTPNATIAPIVITKKFIESPSVAGDYHIANIPKVAPIRRIILKHTNITGYLLEMNGNKLIERTLAENTFYNELTGHRTVQAGYTIIDPGEEGDGGARIIPAGIEDMRLICTMSAADTITLFVQYVGLPTASI